MTRELNIETEQKAIYEKLSKEAVAHLNRRGIVARFAPTREEALSMVMDMIPEGVVVGTNDSLTLLQVGVFSALWQRGRNEIINPFRRDAEGNFLIKDREEQLDVMRKVFLTDVYLIGTNAITLDGKLVNTDGLGNRVAPMLFGPKKVIIVAGANKIVKNLEDAFKRIREVCAPINAYRHATRHHYEEFNDLPCVRTGICVDCNNPWRICRYTTIIEGQWKKEMDTQRLNVVLVGEQLGI